MSLNSAEIILTDFQLQRTLIKLCNSRLASLLTKTEVLPSQVLQSDFRQQMSDFYLCEQKL